MDNLYPDLENAPEGGQILWHIPYSGTLLLVKQADGTWLDADDKSSYTREVIGEDVEATWQKYGDDWFGNAFDWQKEANRLQDIVNEAEMLLASDEPDDWTSARKLLIENKE